MEQCAFNITIALLTTLSIMVSIYAIYCSNNNSDKNNQLALRINSKEYQIKEEMKVHVIQILALLKIIIQKATLVQNNNKTDKNYNQFFEHEANLLNQSLVNYGHILFLKSIDNEDRRLGIQNDLLNLLLSLQKVSTIDDVKNVGMITEYTLSQFEYYRKNAQINDADLCKVSEGLSTL